jgi:hypothetical protein
VQSLAYLHGFYFKRLWNYTVVVLARFLFNSSDPQLEFRMCIKSEGKKIVELAKKLSFDEVNVDVTEELLLNSRKEEVSIEVQVDSVL